MKFYMKENFTIIIQMLYNITILLIRSVKAHATNYYDASKIHNSNRVSG